MKAWNVKITQSPEAKNPSFSFTVLGPETEEEVVEKLKEMGYTLQFNEYFITPLED